MIARIVIGSGNSRLIAELPVLRDRKEQTKARLAIGNLIKTHFLFPKGKGFNEAKLRGANTVFLNEVTA